MTLRVTIFQLLSFFLTMSIYAQPILGLPETSSKGKYSVGYTTIQLKDPIRTFKDGTLRTIKISIWYPSNDGNNSQMRFGDYYSHYYNDTCYTDKNFYPLNSYFDQFAAFFKVPLDIRKKIYCIQLTSSILNQPIDNKTFPLILYAASYRGIPAENANLFELFASNGYVVAGVPSIGAEGREIETDESGVALQTGDLNLLMSYLKTKNYINTNAIVIAGHSFGVFPALLSALKNEAIKGAFSLDGSHTYFKPLLDKLLPENIRFAKPFLQFSQSAISKGNFINRFYEKNCSARSYYFQFRHLLHQDFAGITYLFVNNISPKDTWSNTYQHKTKKTKKEESYISTYKLILNFLKETMHQDKEAGNSIQNIVKTSAGSSIFLEKKMKN